MSNPIQDAQSWYRRQTPGGKAAFIAAMSITSIIVVSAIAGLAISGGSSSGPSEAEQPRNKIVAAVSYENMLKSVTEHYEKGFNEIQEAMKQQSIKAAQQLASEGNPYAGYAMYKALAVSTYEFKGQECRRKTQGEFYCSLELTQKGPQGISASIVEFEITFSTPNCFSASFFQAIEHEANNGIEGSKPTPDATEVAQDGGGPHMLEKMCIYR